MSKTIVSAGDNTCKDCPNRYVGCHNPDNCPKWAAHEAKKKDIYETRLTASTLKSIEQTHVRKFYKRWCDHNRSKK